MDATNDLNDANCIQLSQSSTSSIDSKYSTDDLAEISHKYRYS